MKIDVHAVICVALLASASLMPANAQTANGSQPNNGTKQNTATAQTDGQRKSGQIMHADFNNAPASMPNELVALAPHIKLTATQGSGSNDAQDSKTKVRQEFGPTQASKRNDAVVVPTGSGSKSKTETKTQASK